MCSYKSCLTPKRCSLKAILGQPQAPLTVSPARTLRLVICCRSSVKGFLWQCHEVKAMILFRPKGAEDIECRHFGYVFRAPSGEGGRQVTSENVRLAAKPQMGRGLGTAETNLVAGFSWQGSHGPGGCNAMCNCGH